MTSVAMIKASAPGPFKTYKRQRGGPPQGLFALAAATPAEVSVTLYDETVDVRPPKHLKTDLVVIFASTPDALQAYSIADRARADGCTVVLAGLHATFAPDDAETHADALLLGEAENVWPVLLADFEAGTLRRRYHDPAPVDLTTLKPFPTHLIGAEAYDGFWSVVVGRGCRFKCNFCLVHQFFPNMRQRPIADVVAELRRIPSGAWVELHHDNLTSDRAYAKALFEAITPLGLNWVGEADINITRDDELLALAARSGMRYLLVGLETPSKAALKGAGKAFVRPDEARERVAKLHAHDIIVDSSMLFGFETHDETIFQEALEFVEYVEVDVCDPIIVTPYPGSALFADLDAQDRILTRDWSKYDGAHAVFQPAGMTPEALEYGAGWFAWKYASPLRAVRRKARQVRNVGWSNAWMLR